MVVSVFVCFFRSIGAVAKGFCLVVWLGCYFLFVVVFIFVVLLLFCFCVLDCVCLLGCVGKRVWLLVVDFCQ
jgi:hypothetical protein